MIPTLSRPAFINSLHQRVIYQELPGSSAHQLMAHPVRKADPFADLSNKRDAAVMIILFEKTPGDFQLIFIRRTISKSADKHSGQIAFPGGKTELSDPDLMYTALRETQEEIGIDLTQIDVLGALSPLYINVSKFLVHPFLAWSWTTPVYLRQESEIEEVLELPLSSFMDTASIQETRINLASGIILNHVPCYVVNDHLIWGATAMMMSELLEIIRRD